MDFYIINGDISTKVDSEHIFSNIVDDNTIIDIREDGKTVMKYNLATNANIKKLITKYNADVYCKDADIIRFAVFMYRPRLVDYLISITDMNKLTKINIWLKDAIAQKNTWATRVLLTLFNADPNYDNNYPVQFAVMTKNVEILKLLISKGGKAGDNRASLLNILEKHHNFEGGEELYQVFKEMEE